MTRASTFPAALIALTLLLTPSARADVPPERIPDPCAGKQSGDPCEPSGACKASTCCTTRHVSATIQHYESRKPRDQQNQDIINPPTTCSPCLACEPQPIRPPPDPPASPPTDAPVSPASPPAATGSAMCTVARWPGDLGAAALLMSTLLYTRLRRPRRAR